MHTKGAPRHLPRRVPVPRWGGPTWEAAARRDPKEQQQQRRQQQRGSEPRPHGAVCSAGSAAPRACRGRRRRTTATAAPQAGAGRAAKLLLSPRSPSLRPARGLPPPPTPPPPQPPPSVPAPRRERADPRAEGRGGPQQTRLSTLCPPAARPPAPAHTGGPAAPQTPGPEVICPKKPRKSHTKRGAPGRVLGGPLRPVINGHVRWVHPHDHASSSVLFFPFYPRNLLSSPLQAERGLNLGVRFSQRQRPTTGFWFLFCNGMNHGLGRVRAWDTAVWAGAGRTLYRAG